MLYIRSGKTYWKLTGITEVFSNRRGRNVPAARLVRPCAVCSREFEALQTLPARTLERAAELLANPPVGIPYHRGPYSHGQPPERDVVLTIPPRSGLTTCPEHRGRGRGVTLGERLVATIIELGHGQPVSVRDVLLRARDQLPRTLSASKLDRRLDNLRRALYQLHDRGLVEITDGEVVIRPEALV